MSEFLPEAAASAGQPQTAPQAWQDAPPPPAPAMSAQPFQPAYGQPQQPAFVAPPAAQSYATPPSVVTDGNTGRPWLLAALAGAGAGLVAAFLYASISFIADREVLMLVVAVGGAVGFAVGKVSARDSFANGAVAAIIAVPATLLAAALLVVFTVAGSIPDGLSRLGDVDFAAVLDVYFSDFLGYVWFGASLVGAYLVGVGVNAASD